MKLPFTLSHEQSLKLGFAPNALALPTPQEDVVFIVGLNPAMNKVAASIEAYRVSATGRLSLAHVKTYNLVGPINSVDIRSPSYRVYLSRLSDKYNISEESIVRVIDKPMTEFRRLCGRAIGHNIAKDSDIPGEIRVLNRALEYVSKGKIDHARLLLQWPGFFQAFLEIPEIIDRSVAGESMWDLLPHAFSDNTIRQLRRIRKFSTNWIRTGVDRNVFLETLANACGYLPDGAQRPENADEAESLIRMDDICNQAFRSLGPEMLKRVKQVLFSHTDTWRNTVKPFNPEYAYDYIHFVYYNILIEAFRVNGIYHPTDEQRVAAFFKIVGSTLDRIASSSKSWHQRLPLITRMSKGDIPTSWPAAIDTIHVPAFRTVEMNVNETVTNVYIFPLDSAELLHKEGRDQQHCAYSQVRLCAEGNLRIASIRQKIEERYATLSTFSFTLENGKMLIRDHRGKQNETPSYIAREALGWFEGEVNGKTNKFRFNREWNKADEGAMPPDMRRASLLEKFESCSPALSKRMQKEGFDGLLAVCV